MKDILGGIRFSSLLILVCLATAHNASGQATFSNGSFETGDFTGWIATDNFGVGGPLDPVSVLATGSGTEFGSLSSLFVGVPGFFGGSNEVIPSDGSFAASHGFDGDPGTISIAQDIGIIFGTDILRFDYRSGWDLTTFSNPTSSNRSFDVLLEPAGGGLPIATFPVLTAVVGTNTLSAANLDTGPLSASFDLSPFAGLDARINFIWTVPDSFTGPANAQLDNVAIVTVPEPSSVMSGLFGLAGMIVRRRKKKDY